MPESEARRTYPTMPSVLWWKLRRKFQQSIPGVITDSYLATVLDMEVISARTNVLPSMKAFGLIDSDGKPLERVRLWRDDDSYPDVCKAIVAETYPEELTQAIHEPATDRPKVIRWFANKLGVGTNAAGKMAAMYTMLMEADPSKQTNSQPKTATAKKSARTTHDVGKPAPKMLKDKPASVHDQEVPTIEDSKHRKPLTHTGPDVNINLQVHISADASSDQIEQIFASMAKHFYKNG